MVCLMPLIQKRNTPTWRPLWNLGTCYGFTVPGLDMLWFDGVPGCSRERYGALQGAFGRAFGVENLSSEQKDGSTLSTNAGIEHTHLAPPLERGHMLWFHGSGACFSRAGTGS